MSFLKHFSRVFSSHKFLREQRVVFLITPEEKAQIESMLGNVKKPKDPEVDQNLKNIGFEVRQGIEALNIGVGGGGIVRAEKITENQENLANLLTEIQDYNQAIEGNRANLSDYEDPLGFQLIGGEKDKSEARRFRGAVLPNGTDPYNAYNSMLEARYVGLSQVRDALKNQPDATQKINNLVKKSQGELEDKKEEVQAFLMEERERLLRKLRDYFLQKSERIIDLKAKLNALCVDCSALDDFWQEVETKTDFSQVRQKIESGLEKKDDFQFIEDFSAELDFQTSKIQERLQEIQISQEIAKNLPKKRKLFEKIQKQCRGLVNNFKSLAGVNNFGETQKFLADAEKRLNSGEDIIVDELLFLQDSLNYLSEKFLEGDLGSAQRILNQYADIEKEFEDKFLNEVLAQLKNGLIESANLLKMAKPFSGEAENLIGNLQIKLGVLKNRWQSPQAMKKFAMGIGRLDIEGKMIGDESEVMRKWLLSCLQEQRNLNELIQKALNPPVSEVIKELQNPQKNPLEVVDYLEKQGNLKKVPSAEFAEKYKDTGITNSYFVIEQNEYQGDVAKYQKNKQTWTIYLDEGYFEKIKSGQVSENEDLRFRARIAHELGHREFEESKKMELEKQIDYTGETWLKLKNHFQKLLVHKKNEQAGEIKIYSDADILNETWAFYKEHQVAPLQGEFADLIQKFENLIGLRKTKVFGAEEDTGVGSLDSLLSGASTGLTENSSQEQANEKLEEERRNYLNNFTKLEGYIKLFGGKLPEQEEEKQEEDSSKKAIRRLDLSRIDGGMDFMNYVLDYYPQFKQSTISIDTMNRNQVEDINKIITNINAKFEKAELILSDNEIIAGGYLKQLWGNTKFLSFDDIYQMVTESWAFIQRRRDRKASDSRAAVGIKIFGKTMLGNEYFTKQQKLEMDEVGEYQNNLKNMGHEQIYPLLYAPKNKDHLKAVIYELTSRGRMRWDDARVWNSLERFTFARIPDRALAENDILYRNNQLKKIVAGLWDENTWDGWIKDNTGGLGTAMQNLQQEAQDVHAGGATPVRKKLDDFIAIYKEKIDGFGKKGDSEVIVPSHRYQKLLDYAFEFGKLSMEDKFYYLIAGVKYRIIPIEYLKKIQSERFAVLPILDFFYAKNNTYNEVVDLFNEIEANGGYPNGVHKLLMQKVLHDPITRKRVQKIVSRDGVRNVDHDDWHTLMAAVGSNEVDSLLSKPNGGKAVITKASMINAMASYSSFVKAQPPLIEKEGDKYNYQNLLDSLDSFFAFDSRIMGRVGRAGAYERFSRSDLEEVPFASGISVKDYQESMYKLIRLIFHKYEGSSSNNYLASIFTNTIEMTPEELEKKKKAGMEHDVGEFSKKLNKMFHTPKGKEAIKSALNELSGTIAGYQGREFDYSIKYTK